MDDTTSTALDAEAPVNPYSLLDAVNAAAARTNATWLLFLALMGYVALTAGTVTHRDLLLDAGVALPLLQARIDLVRFFVGAPAILVLAHLALIAQFALLARKASEFHNAVRLLESTDLRSHPLRLQVDSFFHVQAIAGPERSRVVGALLYGLGWLTLLLLPLALLVYLQVAFLPYRNGAVTGLQGTIVLADVAVVLLTGVFLLRAETSVPRALFRLLLNNPGSAAFGLVTVAAAAFVVVMATTGLPGTKPGAPLLGLFPRHLELADARLVSDRASASIGARTVSLRGRDLRFARLDRADLRQADLTGARLDGASLVGADLRGARLGCVEASALEQADARAGAGCTSARRADFTGARMAGAILAGADLTGARLDEASLQRADLSRALMVGATFERARLQRASLASANLRAASLQQASLQGATLADARLEMADLSGAKLQGASLTGAHLAGALLRAAELEAVGLQRAKLYGTDLSGARLVATDLAGALVWRAVPPAADAVSLADIAGIAMKAPAGVEIEAMKATLASVESGESGPTAERTAGFKGLLAATASDGWAGSADGQAWATLLRASEVAMAQDYKTRLAEHLASLACRARFADWVATAIVARGAGAGFKGDPAVLYDRLTAADCAATHTVPRPTMLDLAAAAEAARAAQAAAAKAAAVTPPPPPTEESQGQ